MTWQIKTLFTICDLFFRFLHEYDEATLMLPIYEAFSSIKIGKKYELKSWAFSLKLSNNVLRLHIKF